jgi:RNA ligase (TIGR02306 family)
MERKLATIAKIESIRPHGNADTLELATIRGWQVVVRIGEFKAGDLCVYCEIDSLMPEKEEFEFLAPRKYRIKTTKLRGQISQGIAFPTTILPGEAFGLKEGADVTEMLGVIKYDPPIPASLGGVALGHFFSHSIKTDEERIQNLIDLFPEYHDNYTWTATEKLDGSSCTYTIYDDVFGVASRNLRLKEHPDDEKNTFWKYAREKDIEGKMRKIMEITGMKAITVQGELVGEGIQKNKYKLKGQVVKFFRMFDPITYSFVPLLDAKILFAKMQMEMVPIIETDMTLPDTVEKLIKLADGVSVLYPTAREGIVFVAETVIGGLDARPLDNYQGRLSFKVISNKFILKHDA